MKIYFLSAWNFWICFWKWDCIIGSSTSVSSCLVVVNEASLLRLYLRYSPFPTLLPPLSPLLPPPPSPSIIHSSHSYVRHTRLYSCVIESIFYSRLQIICSYIIVYFKYTITLILASILEGNIVQPRLFFFPWTRNETIVQYSSPIHLNIYSRVSEPASLAGAGAEKLRSFGSGSGPTIEKDE